MEQSLTPLCVIPDSVRAEAGSTVRSPSFGNRLSALHLLLGSISTTLFFSL